MQVRTRVVRAGGAVLHGALVHHMEIVELNGNRKWHIRTDMQRRLG